MNPEFKIVIADSDEYWLRRTHQSLEDQQDLRLNVLVRPFYVGEGSQMFTTAQATAMLPHHCGVFRPLYRISPHQSAMLEDIQSYRVDEFTCTISLRPTVWMANSLDRTHPRWPRFREWTSLHHHCVIDEDANWNEFGGACRLALLASLYLYFRSEIQYFNQVQLPLIDFHSRVTTKKDPFKKPFTWPLEQSLLIRRLRLIQQKDRMLLRHDRSASLLATLI